jgi:phosphoribosyl-dephospho-CoA transferase
MQDISIKVEHHHLTLTRYHTRDVISVTMGATGEVIDAYSLNNAFTIELTEEEILLICELLGIEPH